MTPINSNITDIKYYKYYRHKHIFKMKKVLYNENNVLLM